MTTQEELEITGAQAHLSNVKIDETRGKMSSDQMHYLPVTYSQGWNYIMVLHDCNLNTVLSEPLKYRAESELLRALTAL